MSSKTTWDTVISEQKQQPYFSAMLETVDQLRQSGKVIYPDNEHVFSAFEATPFEQVKVVILGQDPYHGPNQAHGLSFSVLPNVKVPPSLANMYKELVTDIEGFEIPNHGYLQSWAEQGVLLLNTVLTVEQGKAHSHAKLGWETFTDTIIEKINAEHQGVVFLLWGAHAQKKGQRIDRTKHCVLTSAHPSPLSAYRGFFGCRHFSQANAWLQEQHKDPIDWRLPMMK